MKTLTSSPGALRILVISIVARLPLAMLAISLLVHTVHLTGSYATAGIVSGVNAVALGIGGPLLGKLVDRRGQTGVLVVGGCSAGALLCAVARAARRSPRGSARRARGGHRAGDAATRGMHALAPALARARRLGGTGGLRRGDLRRRADVGRGSAARARHRRAAVDRVRPGRRRHSARRRDRALRCAARLARVAAGACRSSLRRRGPARAGDADAGRDLRRHRRARRRRRGGCRRSGFGAREQRGGRPAARPLGPGLARRRHPHCAARRRCARRRGPRARARGTGDRARRVDRCDRQSRLARSACCSSPVPGSRLPSPRSTRWSSASRRPAW